MEEFTGGVKTLESSLSSLSHCVITNLYWTPYRYTHFHYFYVPTNIKFRLVRFLVYSQILLDIMALDILGLICEINCSTIPSSHHCILHCHNSCILHTLQCILHCHNSFILHTHHCILHCHNSFILHTHVPVCCTASTGLMSCGDAQFLVHLQIIYELCISQNFSNIYSILNLGRLCVDHHGWTVPVKTCQVNL